MIRKKQSSYNAFTQIIHKTSATLLLKCILLYPYMSERRKNIYFQAIKWLLPLLFIFFINGQSFFTHFHLEDNTIVVHSHPFNKGEKRTHHHTSKELIAIEFHSHGFSTDSIISHIELNSPFFIIITHDYLQKNDLVFSREINSVLLRAPPHVA